MPIIYLIGMPGSGKSTIGKKLASILKYSFLDFDNEIERKEGATIKAIFSLKGEDYFRQIEAQVLSKVSRTEKNKVVATGGGTPCNYNGLELMNSTGITVFINVSPTVLIDRLKSEANRPLLIQDVEKNIIKLHEERIDVYLKAAIKVEADNISTVDLTKRIVEELKSY